MRGLKHDLAPKGSKNKISESKKLKLFRFRISWKQIYTKWEISKWGRGTSILSRSNTTLKSQNAHFRNKKFFHRGDSTLQKRRGLLLFVVSVAQDNRAVCCKHLFIMPDLVCFFACSFTK